MSSSLRVENRIAIVTGAGSGIGQASAIRLAEEGATIICADINGEAANATAKQIVDSGFKAEGQSIDISDSQACTNLVDSTAAKFGSVDILVNNAGWTTPVPHHDLDALTDEIFLKTFEVNVYGTWYLSKAAIPYLKQSEDGNIVNITSIAGVRQVGSSMAYSMTKAALNQMTKLMAKSCWPVRINAVAPGLIETPWTADWDAMHTNVAKSAPLKRSGTPDDCTEATLGLLRTKYATGQIFVVDGGLTLMS